MKLAFLFVFMAGLAFAEFLMVTPVGLRVYGVQNDPKFLSNWIWPLVPTAIFLSFAFWEYRIYKGRKP